MNNCERLASENCGKCREEVRLARHWSETAGTEVLDSGGLPMLRDGVKNKLQDARLTSLDAKRRLRHARGVVLRAQRQAEWAHDENTKEVARLKESKGVLGSKEKELSDWHGEHTKKMEAIQMEWEEQRKELQRTRLQMHRAKDRLFRVRRNLAKFSHGQHAQRWKQLEKEAQERFKRRHLQVKEVKQALKALRMKLRMGEEDAKWLDQGMRKDIDEARELVQKDFRAVKATHLLWEHSVAELDEAKKHYWQALSVSHMSDSQAEVLNHRLSDFATTTPFSMPNMTLPKPVPAEEAEK